MATNQQDAIMEYRPPKTNAATSTLPLHQDSLDIQATSDLISTPSSQNVEDSLGAPSIATSATTLSPGPEIQRSESATKKRRGRPTNLERAMRLSGIDPAQSDRLPVEKTAGLKRALSDVSTPKLGSPETSSPLKRKRGRPKGSTNKRPIEKDQRLREYVSQSIETVEEGTQTEPRSPARGPPRLPRPLPGYRINVAKLESALRSDGRGGESDWKTEVGWTQKDEALMSLKIQSRVLHRLWKMMLHSFQACPYELFTWGLYPHHNDRADILEELCKLLPHKLWGGRLWLLRYMLQMSVFSRCKNHMEPLGPLSSEMMDLVCSLVGSPAEGDSPQLKARRATTALSLWKATRPELEPRVAGVIRALHERAQSEAEADSSGVGEEEQHHKDEDEDEDEETSRLNSTIFLLRKADVVRLRQSLDSLPFFDHTADEFFQAYEASYASVWDELEPRDAATLYRWECLCTRKCIRDQMCREPIIPAAELQTFLRAPYWGSPYCDPRFRASLVPRGEPREPEHQD